MERQRPLLAERRVETPPAADQPTDAQLARRVQRGDIDAYGELVERHMAKAYRVAYRLLSQAQDAEDLVQDAFVAALQKIESFDATRDFAPWFYRILVNRCLNARKARSRRSTTELNGSMASSGRSPLVDAEISELRKQLRDAMDALPERQRTIVALSDLEGFSSPEIADMLEITDGTVRWHLHQARHALRASLEPLVRRKA